MNQKLDVSGTLSQIFSTYGAQAGVLLPVAFGLYLLVAIVNAIIVGSFLLFPLGLAVTVVAATLYQGMVVGLVKDVQDGQRDSTVGDLIDSTWPVVLPLIGAGILAGIAIGVGFLLLVVPGLILLTIWAVIAPVIVVEHSGVMESFGRSRELVRSNGWQVFGVIFVVFLIAAIVSAILGAIGTGISDSVGMRILFNLIASTLTAPIAALAAATIYFRLLAIKGEPATPGAPPPPPTSSGPPPPAAPPAPPTSSGPPPPPAPPAPPSGPPPA
jgi:ABC-type multidrug transport system fused ATPase/permease subunit